MVRQAVLRDLAAGDLTDQADSKSFLTTIFQSRETALHMASCNLVISLYQTSAT